MAIFGNFTLVLHWHISYYSGLSLSRTRKGPRNLFEIERVRDREKLVNLRKTENEKKEEKWLYDKQ